MYSCSPVCFVWFQPCSDTSPYGECSLPNQLVIPISLGYTSLSSEMIDRVYNGLLRNTVGSEVPWLSHL